MLLPQLASRFEGLLSIFWYGALTPVIVNKDAVSRYRFALDFF